MISQSALDYLAGKLSGAASMLEIGAADPKNVAKVMRDVAAAIASKAPPKP